MKQDLFYCMENEKSQSIRHLLADAIGEIGGNLLEDCSNNNSQWPELVPNIWRMLSSENISLVEAGMKIIATMLTFCAEYLQQFNDRLKVIFQQGIQNPHFGLKLATFYAITNYICFSDFHNDQQQLATFIPPLLDNVALLL